MAHSRMMAATLFHLPFYFTWCHWEFVRFDHNFIASLRKYAAVNLTAEVWLDEALQLDHHS